MNMRKLGVLILFLLVFASVSACREKSEDHLNTYASDISVKAEFGASSRDYPEVAIEVRFTQVDYIPVTRKIGVAFTIHDDGWTNATYFVALMQRDSIYPTTTTFFEGYGSDFPGSASFTIPDDGNQYGIAVGKIDQDLSPSNRYHYSAWLEWEDPHFADRSFLGEVTQTNTTLPTTDDYMSSYVSFTFTIQEPPTVLSHLTVLIREPDSDAVVGTMEINADDSVRSGGKLVVKGEFDGLAPGVEYSVEVYGDGNDGVDSFTDLFLFRMPIASPLYEGQDYVSWESSFHGLYALIYQMEYTEDELLLSYYYHNDGTVCYEDSNRKVKLQLVCLNEEYRMAFTVEMTEGDHTVTIPFSDIGPDYSFQIVDLEKTGSFDAIHVGSFDPAPSLWQLGDGSYQIRFFGDSRNVLSIDIEVYLTGYPLCIETIKDVDFAPGNSFTIYHDFASADTRPYMVIVVTYVSYGRRITERVYC